MKRRATPKGDLLSLGTLGDVELDMRYQRCPPFLQQVIDLAQATIRPSAIILFGSFARGDNTRNSDFDLAFKQPDKFKWSRFVLDLDEHAKTLRPFDLLVYEEASLALRNQIDQEGIILYATTKP